MPIIFANDTAFVRLKQYGFVTTFRASEHGEAGSVTDVRRSRTGEKEFCARVEHVASVVPSPANLEQYAPFSGFENGGAWLIAIQDTHGEVADRGHVYQVHRALDRE